MGAATCATFPSIPKILFTLEPGADPDGQAQDD